MEDLYNRIELSPDILTEDLVDDLKTLKTEDWTWLYDQYVIGRRNSTRCWTKILRSDLVSLIPDQVFIGIWKYFINISILIEGLYIGPVLSRLLESNLVVKMDLVEIEKMISSGVITQRSRFLKMEEFKDLTDPNIDLLSLL